MKETIFFVEDDKSIHALIKATLEINGYKVEGFTDPLDYLEALKRKVPDLLVLDLMLPNMSGYDVISYMRKDERYAWIPVIILSALSDELDIVTGLDRGAVDYITKPFGVLEFVSRIKSNLHKSRHVTERKCAIKVRGLVVDADKHECTLDGKPVILTAKEFKLLYLLAFNSPRVVSRSELLSEIWGYGSEIETRTLDMHIKTVREKLAKISQEPYVVTVRGVGFVISGEE